MKAMGVMHKMQMICMRDWRRICLMRGECLAAA
jgi:hypothetical protein